MQETQYKYLDKVDSPDDLKRLRAGELTQYCAELRRFIIAQLSSNPGHLGSSLGVVELTVALHYVLNTPDDKLVWDVGHQAYAHKIITGRRDRFCTNRKLGGLSGFPKMGESLYDAFGAGHSSTSISAALGIAIASVRRGEKREVVAVIGDGALTGGLAFEGLNNAGASNANLLVVLNDNRMSIDPNVGALKEYLLNITTSKRYNQAKHHTWTRLERFPKLRRTIQKMGNALKGGFLQQSNLFESLNFRYFGPVDGHNVEQLTRVLKDLKEIPGPKLLHVLTVKGKGYQPAEEHQRTWHAPGLFNPETGERLGHTRNGAPPRYQDVFGETLRQLARQDGRVCAITAAMADGTGLGHFAGAYPDRFFDVGIAEGHGAAMAAGLARQGMLPVFAVYSSFLQRSYDMLIHDIALQGLHVVLGVDRAGLVGADGETHHGCFDALFLSEIPGFTVYCPASFAELRRMLSDALFRCTGPVAVRYPRGGEGDYRADAGENALTCLRQGGDAAILTYGILVNEALAAAEALSAEGMETAVYKLNRISPLDWEDLRPLGSVRRLAVVEDAMGAGCVGQRVTAILTEHGWEPEGLVLRNLGKTFAPEGSVRQLWERFGLDRRGMAAAVREVMAP